ncbi:MAG TPA: HhH-GPD-type base excision DNA repair protein [Streptosporangiaceae bacterium]|nr:HhH-GPD-type base excision DNA repair protein [Streptosporangiaceae bacterium]
MNISLPIDQDANELLSRDPLALLIGMLLDQQVPLEKAFTGPRDLVRRLGHEPTAGELAGYDPDALAAVFSERPALHRYPRAMAARVQDLARVIAGQYGGDAAQLWLGAATGPELVRRIGGLPGFGPAKAQIFAALLGKQLGVRPPGWREAAGQFGQDGSRKSVADITDGDSLAEVRAYKQQLKAAAKAGAGH